MFQYLMFPELQVNGGDDIMIAAQLHKAVPIDIILANVFENRFAEQGMFIEREAMAGKVEEFGRGQDGVMSYGL